MRCIDWVPVGETPTGAAETAALPMQKTTVHGQPPFHSDTHWDQEPHGAQCVAPASWSAAVLCRFWSVRAIRKAPEDWRSPKPAGVFLPPFGKYVQLTNDSWVELLASERTPDSQPLRTTLAACIQTPRRRIQRVTRTVPFRSTIISRADEGTGYWTTPPPAQRTSSCAGGSGIPSTWTAPSCDQ